MWAPQSPELSSGYTIPAWSSIDRRVQQPLDSVLPVTRHCSDLPLVGARWSDQGNSGAPRSRPESSSAWRVVTHERRPPPFEPIPLRPTDRFFRLIRFVPRRELRIAEIVRGRRQDTSVALTIIRTFPPKAGRTGEPNRTGRMRQLGETIGGILAADFHIKTEIRSNRDQAAAPRPSAQ